MSRSILSMVTFLALTTLAGSLCHADADEPIKLDADTLLKEFRADKDATSKKYKSKTLEVTGWVRGTANAPAKRREIDLVEAGDSKSKEVLARIFNKDEAASASKITVRRKVVISGVYKESDAARVLRLEDCKIVKVFDPVVPKK